jgi:hypothetical protein
MTMTILLIASLASTVPLVGVWLGDAQHHRARQS